MKTALITITTLSYNFFEEVEVDSDVDESEALDMAEEFLANEGCDNIEEELQSFDFEVHYS